jgi:hypothetical protein
MATNFPASLDSLTNPAAGDSLSSPSHSAQHANVNDAVEALQAKVGVDGSAVTSSLDYKVANQGLTLVKSQNIIGPTASVTVTNAFSSTFDNYRITVNADGSANGIGYEFQLGSATTGYYWTGSYLTLSVGPTRFVGNNVGHFNMGVTGANHDTMAVSDVFWPYQGLRTSYVNHSTGAAIYYNSAGFQQDFTSFTDFTIYIISPYTLNAGTIRVYGYNNG